MAISQAMCTSFKGEVLQGAHELETNTLKIALFTSSASLGAATTAYSTTNEISGTGYTAGGATLSSATAGTSGVVGYFDCDDPAWTGATFTANGAVIYNYSNSNKAIAILAFGADYSVSGGTFTIEFPAAGTSAVIRID